MLQVIRITLRHRYESTKIVYGLFFNDNVSFADNHQKRLKINFTLLDFDVCFATSYISTLFNSPEYLEWLFEYSENIEIKSLQKQSSTLLKTIV